MRKYFTLENLGIALLFIASLMVIYGPVVIGGKVFFDSGALSAHYPAYAFFSRALQSSNSFTWSSGYLSGFPIYLAQFGFFHPLNILYKFFSFFSVYNWLIFLNFFLTLVITYLLARNLSLSKISSLVVAFSYTLSHWWLNLGMLGHANFMPIFPFMFLSLIKISQKKKVFIFIGALVLTMGWLVTSTEDLLYTIVIVFLFALFLDIKNYNSQIRFLRNFSTTLIFLIVVGASLILSSFWTIQVIQFIQLSLRGEAGTQLAQAGRLEIGDIIRLFYPHFKFRFIPTNAASFIGVLSFLLAIASFLLPKKNRIMKFFIFLAILTFLLFFKYSPFILIFQYLPIFNLFRSPAKFWLDGIFALTILAGFGLDNLEAIRELPRFKKYVKILKIFAISVLGLVLAANLVTFFLKSKIINLATWFFDKYLYFKTTRAPLEYYHQIITEIFNQSTQLISFTNPRFLVALIFTLISILFLIFYHRGRSKVLVRNFKIIALIIIVLNLLLFWKVDNNVHFFESKKYFTDPPPIAKFLQDRKSEKEPFRIYRFAPELRPVEYIELGLNDLRANPRLLRKVNFETLMPNANLIYDIDSIEGHEHFITSRYSKIIQTLGTASAFLLAIKGSRWDELSRDSSITTEEKFQMFQSERNRSFLSMMNVRYVISMFKFPSPWIKVFETSIVEEKIGDSVAAYIYENPDVLPRVYFADSAKIIEPDDEKAFDLLMEIKDFKKDILIECLECQNYELGIMNQGDEIFVEEIRDGYLRLKTKTVSPRWLIRSESNLPTWEARINGQLTKIYTANYLYQGILVPAGENEIEFKYPGIFKQFSYSLKDLIKLKLKL